MPNRDDEAEVIEGNGQIFVTPIKFRMVAVERVDGARNARRPALLQSLILRSKHHSVAQFNPMIMRHSRTRGAETDAPVSLRV